MTVSADEIILPPLPAQEGLWFAESLAGTPGEHVVPLLLRLTGPLDEAALIWVLDELPRRHAALRAGLRQTPDGAVVQVVRPAAAPEFTRLSIKPEELPDVVADDQRTPFQLESPPLWRTRLLALSAQEHLLLITAHHVIADGGSLEIIARDIIMLYDARAGSHTPPPAVAGSDYEIYVRSVAASAESARTHRSMRFWKTELASLSGAPGLPAATLTGPGRRRAATVTSQLPDDVVRVLRQMAADGSATLFMVFGAAVAALNMRQLEEPDGMIGVTVGGRMSPNSREVVGMLLNTLPLRIRELEPELPFDRLLARIRGALLNAMRHSNVPFHHLVRAANPERVRGHHPLFRLVLNHTVHDGRPSAAGGLTIERLPTTNATGAAELTIRLIEHGDSASLSFEYDVDLFEAGMIESLASQLGVLLRCVAVRPDAPVGKLALLDESARTAILEGFNSTAAPLAPLRLHELIEDQVRASVERTALVLGDSRLSYAELDRRTDRLAARLAAEGVGPDVLVGVYMERSIEMVVALLGILKAGGAYLPLEPDLPDERLRYMVSDSGSPLVLVQRDLAERFPACDGGTLVIDDAVEQGQPRSEDQIPHGNPDDLAYCMYTSGSTGRPKGVGISHRAIVNRLQWMQSEFDLHPADRVLQKTPFGFDLSVWELFWPLLQGATLVIVPPGGHRDPALLADLIQREEITTAHFVPSMLQEFVREPSAAGCVSLRRVICGGEALSRALADRFHATLPGTSLSNLYGPTETTLDVTAWHDSSPRPLATVPIGRPIWNTQAYVLDEGLEPVAVGIAGDLYIAGEQLARGYLGRPDLTAARFVACPYGPRGSRMYRTGDRARWRADGALEFLGRSDFQIKLRGFRIEPGEIEALLADHQSVSAASVILREDREEDPRLVAYVVAAAEQDIDVDDLRTLLAAQLPDHMVPSAIIRLPHLPVTQNGKLDRLALPAPPMREHAQDHRPRTQREHELCDLFADALSLPEVGIHDNLFDLGAHSLLLVRLVANIRRALGVELSLAALLEAGTVTRVAAHLQSNQQEPTVGAIVEFATDGDQPPVFCVHPVNGLAWSYAGLRRTLGAQRPLYGLQASGLHGDEVLPQTMGELAADYAERIRTVLPEGPYNLIGWSFGGNLAHAIAVELQEHADVGLLALLDAFPTRARAGDAAPLEEEALAELLRGLGGGSEPDDEAPLTREGFIRSLRESDSPLANVDTVVLDRMVDVAINHIRIDHAAEPGYFDGDAVVFNATEGSRARRDELHRWRPYIAGELTKVEVKADHYGLLDLGPLDVIGAALADLLERRTPAAIVPPGSRVST